MDSESVKIYTRRIASANKSEIIVIIYDIIEESLTLAEQALRNGERERFRENVRRAITFTKELLVSLDMKYEVAKNLARLYIYTTRSLNFALISEKTEEIGTAKKVMSTLRVAFSEAAKTDSSEAVMEQTGKLYAGFTYGKELALSETMLAEGESFGGILA